jgi:hypothetical protein
VTPPYSLTINMSMGRGSAREAIFLIRWLLALSVGFTLLLAGCARIVDGLDAETIYDARLIINNVVIDEPAVAYVKSSKGFWANITVLTRELGGTVQFYDRFGVLVTLNGKRILLGDANEEVQYDTNVVGALVFVDGHGVVGNDYLVTFIKLLYPDGTAFRDGKDVIIRTTQG